jgi:hypothetical protein
LVSRPALANVYRKTVAELRTVVHSPETSREAFGLIRGLIDAVIFTPVNGELASILAPSKTGENKAFSTTEKALQIKMVAGARSHLYRTRVHYEREARELTLPSIPV